MFNTDSFNTRQFNQSPNLTLLVATTIALLDSLSVRAEWKRSVDDTVGVTDSFARVWNAHVSLSDNIPVTGNVGQHTFNRLGNAPSIIGAEVSRMNIGSAQQEKPTV